MAGLILVGAKKIGKDAPKESEGKKVTFDYPDGFEFPEDRTKTEVLAEIKKDKDGKICLLSIDGYALPYSDKPDEEESEDSTDEAEGNVDENENSLEGTDQTHMDTNADEAFASDENSY